MPRKPTRSGNTSRPTRRNLDSRLDSLDEYDDLGDVPKMTLVEMFSYELEPVDPERGLFRLDGDLRRCAPGTELYEIVRNSATGSPGDSE